MISPIGSTGMARGLQRSGDTVAKADVAAPAKMQVDAAGAAPVTTAAAQLAAEGAPVDTAKVSAIREQLAQGTYKVDPKAIADRMIALDLPGKA